MAKPADSTRDPDVISFGAFSGLRNDVSSERFEGSDLDLGDNIDIDNTGRIQRRAGRTRVSATATHSLWSDGGALAFCVQGSELKKVALDYTTTTVLTGLTPGLVMSYVKINDNVYFSNTQQRGVWTPSGVRSWGLPVAPTPGVSTGFGALPAGDYQFVATHVRNDGQEGGASLAGRVTVGENSSITFTMPLPTDASIAYHSIYLSPPNGDVLYRAVDIVVPATSASYAGDTSEFVDELFTQFLQAPPLGHLVGYYAGRAYVAVDDVLYPSEPFAYELFDLRNYIPMSGRVTMIAPLEDKESLEAPGMNSGLFLGTDRSCGVLVGNDPKTFQYVPKTDYGAIEGALDFVDGTLFGSGEFGARQLPMWLSTQGVCIGVPGMEIRNLTRSRYAFTAAGRGAALFQSNPNRFVAISNF